MSEIKQSGIKPYFQDGGVVLYHGDNRDILPTLDAHDLLLTDPPYGIDADNPKRRMSRGKLVAPVAYVETAWDKEPADNAQIALAKGLTRQQIIWGGNYYDLPPSSCWLVWDKVNYGTHFADCELAWTNLSKAVRMIKHQWNGMLRKGNEPRFHPTQKPLDVIQWCISLSPRSQSILDPWAGSGTTLVAAKALGKTVTGIEQNERYCEITAKRLSQSFLHLEC